MSADPSPCPSCGKIVDVDEVLALDQCPSCGTALRELFRLGRGRSGGDQA